MILISGRIEVDPERIDEMRAAIDAVAPASRAEEGCIEYEFWEHRVDRGVFHVFERWEDSDALSAHLRSDHYRSFSAVLRELAPSVVDVQTYAAEPT